jgi:hypothetical protein
MKMRTTNTLAIASLALGILGLLGCVCGGGIGGLLLGIPAAICGWTGWSQIKKSGQGGTELAIIGLILGAIEVIGGILVLVFAGAVMGLSFLSSIFQK